jgi:hypothetical protein
VIEPSRRSPTRAVATTGSRVEFVPDRAIERARRPIEPHEIRLIHRRFSAQARTIRHIQKIANQNSTAGASFSHKQRPRV